MARCRRRAQWLSAGLAAIAVTGAAAAPPAPPATAPAAVPAPASAELLLYLSEFEDADGDWIDPSDLPSGDAPATAGEDEDAP